AARGLDGRDENGELENARPSLRFEQPRGRRRIVGACPESVDRVGREHDQLSTPGGGRRVMQGGGERRERHGWRGGRRPLTTRSRPVRSRCTESSTKPARSAASDTDAAVLSSISTATSPPGRRLANAWGN